MMWPSGHAQEVQPSAALHCGSFWNGSCRCVRALIFTQPQEVSVTQGTQAAVCTSAGWRQTTYCTFDMHDHKI